MPDWGTAIGIGGNLIGGMSANNRAEDNAQMSEQAMQDRLELDRWIAEQQLGLSQEQLGMAKQQQMIGNDQYLRYLNAYEPLENAILDDVWQGPQTELAAGRASADVAASFAKSNDVMQRDMARYGINPNSGRFAEMLSGQGLDRSRTEVHARNKARQDAEDEHWAKRITAVDMGRGLPGQAATMLSGAGSMVGAAGSRISSAGSALGQGYDAMQQHYAGIAGNAANSAGQMFSNVGHAIGNADWGSWGNGGGGTSPNYGLPSGGDDYYPG